MCVWTVCILDILYFVQNFLFKFFLIFIVSRPEKSVLAKTLNEHHWTYWFPLADLCFLLGCLFGIEFQTFLQTNSWMASWTPHEFSVSHLFRIFAGSRHSWHIKSFFLLLPQKRQRLFNEKPSYISADRRKTRIITFYCPLCFVHGHCSTVEHGFKQWISCGKSSALQRCSSVMFSVHEPAVVNWWRKI